MSSRNFSQKKNSFISFLGEVVGLAILFRDLLTFRVTKILDFFCHHLISKLWKQLFYYLYGFFRNVMETNEKLQFLGGENCGIDLFFNFFQANVSDFVSNLNDDIYEASFEVYYVYLSPKLVNLGFFSFWPRSLLKPTEAKLWASVTSLRSQILAEDKSFHMKSCL